MWTRSCLVSWPVGYRSTCRESWGRLRTGVGVAPVWGKHRDWPPPGVRCSASTSWVRTATARPAAGADGRLWAARLSLDHSRPVQPRPVQAGSVGGRGVDCAPSGRWLSRTSSDGCRTGSVDEGPSPGEWPVVALRPSEPVFARPRGRGSDQANRGVGRCLRQAIWRGGGQSDRDGRRVLPVGSAWPVGSARTTAGAAPGANVARSGAAGFRRAGRCPDSAIPDSATQAVMPADSDRDAG
ncbi:hypothetical protein SAMN04489732_11777 [Amycolatopsis saalfeldensis]|uniref:Uncharacterized protein n=1 Tax=Amycolatopsis saalfeldensis TaxID=394193 RepID=A0A1H8YHW6_9PSEU|nr:hypothetical protein SAMN04489732_11777 [Amycolatopsis saalfeldensis]